jgi:hypothetical protein
VNTITAPAVLRRKPTRRTTAVLLLSRETLLAECMAVALSPIGGVEGVAMGPDEPGAGRGSFEICVLSAVD